MIIRNLDTIFFLRCIWVFLSDGILPSIIKRQSAIEFNGWDSPATELKKYCTVGVQYYLLWKVNYSNIFSLYIMRCDDVIFNNVTRLIRNHFFVDRFAGYSYFWRYHQKWTDMRSGDCGLNPNNSRYICCVCTQSILRSYLVVI